MTSPDTSAPRTDVQDGTARRGGVGRRLLLALPALFFLAMGAVFLLMLLGGRDAQKLPSVLVGRPAPTTDLPPLEGLLAADSAPVPGLADADLRAGRVTVLNVFASWCGPCRDEHPQIMALAQDPRIRVVGLNHTDAPANARRFLQDFGNPYAAVGVDPRGRAAIDWGVYGVPETFVIDGAGRIVHKTVGPVTRESLDAVLRPAIERTLAGGG
jgi:cytochrome c biogenesis protein CcmG/thiol:disulfide interchange protein DsbE